MLYNFAFDNKFFFCLGTPIPLPCCMVLCILAFWCSPTLSLKLHDMQERPQNLKFDRGSKDAWKL